MVRPRVEVPEAVVEGVAGELGTAAAIVRPIVEWVVNYLNKKCCWSVGIDRLARGLARARDEEVRFSLYVLGYEGGPSIDRLRQVLLVIIKHLREAGIVEYVEDLGVVNYVRH